MVTLEPDTQMQSLIGWLGGKKALAKTLVALLPKHQCYAEVFGGAGWLLFAKEPSPREVYNDLDGRLVELFRSVKYHAQELCRELDLLVPSREMFEDFRAQPGLTEIQRAARFYVLLRLSFGSLGRTFGAARKQGGFGRLALAKVQADVERIRERLEGVLLEHRDFGQVVDQFDGADTCFFLDPPYVETTGYAVPFGMDDHERLLDLLGTVQGRWLLSYGDHPWVRDNYERWRVHEVHGPCSVSGKANKPMPHLLITNYRLTKAQLAAAPREVRPV